MNFEFSRQNFEKTHNRQISQKSLQWELSLFHVDEQADGRTDRETDKTKLIVVFRKFA